MTWALNIIFRFFFFYRDYFWICKQNVCDLNGEKSVFYFYKKIFTVKKKKSWAACFAFCFSAHEGSKALIAMQGFHTYFLSTKYTITFIAPQPITKFNI